MEQKPSKFNLLMQTAAQNESIFNLLLYVVCNNTHIKNSPFGCSPSAVLFIYFGFNLHSNVLYIQPASVHVVKEDVILMFLKVNIWNIVFGIR